MLKNEKFKIILNRFVVMTLLMFLIMNSSISFVHAETAKQRLERIKKEEKEAKADQKAIESEITRNLEAISDLEKQIKEKEVEIKQIADEIEETQKIVDGISKDLKEQEENYLKQEVLVKKRLTFMYEQGEYSAWELLLKSDGIMNFLSNYYMLQELSAIDNEILSESSKNKRKIEILKKELDSKEKLLNEAKTRAENSKRQQENIVVAKEGQKEKLNKKEKEILKKIDNLEKMEREARAQIAREAAAQYESGSQIYVGGEFTWPAPTAWYITTHFGWTGPPNYPVYSYHKGIDIAPASSESHRDHPIVAAQDGVVVSAGYNYGGYGNAILIAHGSGKFTYYAHGENGSISVYPGQQVKKGQRIMLMGNTGFSFGKHLHFEVIDNPHADVHDEEYLKNPLTYLKK